jgi:hypothetical protein
LFIPHDFTIWKRLQERFSLFISRGFQSRETMKCIMEGNSASPSLHRLLTVLPLQPIALAAALKLLNFLPVSTHTTALPGPDGAVLGLFLLRRFAPRIRALFMAARSILVAEAGDDAAISIMIGFAPDLIHPATPRLTLS